MLTLVPLKQGQIYGSNSKNVKIKAYFLTNFHVNKCSYWYLLGQNTGFSPLLVFKIYLLQQFLREEDNFLYLTSVL